MAWLGVGISTRSQECECDRYNEKSRNVSDQMPMTTRPKRLHGHDAAMNHAGPNSEPNEAAMCQWIAGRKEQEYSQRGVDANDHERVV